jgi:succinate-acetate transporter protein
MRRTGVVILYVVAAAIAFGGVGDLTVHALFDAVVAAEGANAVGMYAFGSFWYVSATFVLLTALVAADNSKAQELA